MKQLIKLQDKFILVSDEKLKDGDWFYNTFSDNQPLIQKRKGDWKTCFNQRKILAGIPELPSIDFSMLSEADCKRIGWVDVAGLAEKTYREYPTNPSDKPSWHYNRDGNFIRKRKAFIKGFKAHQSITDKMYSLEDIKNALFLGINLSIDDTKIIDKYLQSLQQKVWDVEVEMEEKCWCMKPQSGGCIECIKKPKIDNNSIKVTKIL